MIALTVRDQIAEMNLGEWAALTKRAAARAVAAATRLGQAIPPELAEAACLTEAELIERRLALNLETVRTPGSRRPGPSDVLSDDLPGNYASWSEPASDEPDQVFAPPPDSDRSPSRLAMICADFSVLNPVGSENRLIAEYVIHTSIALASRGLQVEIFARGTGGDPPVTKLDRGVLIRNVVRPPFAWEDNVQAGQEADAFAAEVFRLCANLQPDYFRWGVHGHGRLSGWVGCLLKERWDVPMTYTPHLSSAIYNATLNSYDATANPALSVIERTIVGKSEVVIAESEAEARLLVDAFNVKSDSIHLVDPGIDRSLDSAWQGIVDALLSSYDRAIQSFRRSRATSTERHRGSPQETRYARRKGQWKLQERQDR